MKFKRFTAAVLALTIAASSAVSLYGSAAEPAAVPQSASAAKTAPNAPAAPVFTDAVRTSEGAQFTWSRVSGVDGYMLYHYNQTGGYKHVILGADITTYLWRDFDPTYTYAIVSYINVGNETIKSEPTIMNGSDVENAQTPTVQAPQMPVYQRMGRGKTALRVYWQPLECDGVEVSIRKENGTWSIAGYDTANASNFRVEGLTPGTKYQFRLRAYNVDSSGNKVFSVYNSNIFGETVAENLAKPAQVRITSAGKSSNAVRVYWESVACSGYEVYIFKNNHWVLAGEAGPNDTNKRIEGLEPNTVYWVTVRAFNKSTVSDAVAYGEYSANKKVTTKPAAAAVTAPAAPTITKIGKGKTALRVYWQPLTCDGVEVSIRKENEAWTVAGTASANDSNFRVENLTPGTRYQFRIRAYNTDSSGNRLYSGYTASDYVQTTSASLAKPAKVKVTSAGKSTNAVRIYWESVPCTGYEVYIFKNNQWVLAGEAGANDTNMRVEGLAPDTVYWLTVRAFNRSGSNVVYGDYSDNKKVTTKKPASSVTAPAQVNITKISKGKTAIRLTWQPQDVDGYEVYRKVNGTYIYSDTVDGKEDNIRYGGLAPSTAYYFKVRAFRYDNGSKVYGEFSPNVKATTKDDPTALNIENRNGVTYVNGVLIVNKTYSVPSSYGPGGLTSETAAAFADMQAAASRDGISLWCASGYRSYSYQSTLYNDYVARDGRTAADRYSARPGHSEHQTGLALDVNNPSSSFNNTREARWLAQHCTDYGFIIRYPEGKESSTGFQYEPWHIRYLGKDLAKKVTESGKTLEEYFGITSVYNY